MGFGFKKLGGFFKSKRTRKVAITIAAAAGGGGLWAVADPAVVSSIISTITGTAPAVP